MATNPIWCDQCESMVPATFPHSCFSAKQVRAVRDAEAAVVVAAEAWKEARKDDHLGPRARWSAEALEAALTALHAARQGEASGE